MPRPLPHHDDRPTARQRHRPCAVGATRPDRRDRCAPVRIRSSRSRGFRLKVDAGSRRMVPKLRDEVVDLLLLAMRQPGKSGQKIRGNRNLCHKTSLCLSPVFKPCVQALTFWKLHEGQHIGSVMSRHTIAKLLRKSTSTGGAAGASRAVGPRRIASYNVMLSTPCRGRHRPRQETGPPRAGLPRLRLGGAGVWLVQV